LRRSGIGIAVEVANQTIEIPRGPFGQVLEKFLSHLSSGIAEGLSPTEFSGVAFHQRSIEPMLTDEKTQSVAEAGFVVLAV